MPPAKAPDVTVILLVEDEIVIALGASMVLEDAGYTVHLAPNGSAGLQQAIAMAPDLIMTDQMMPHMDGMTMIRELRQRGITVPILLATSMPEAKLGAGPDRSYDAFLPKPYRDAPLLQVVQRLLEKAR